MAKIWCQESLENTMKRLIIFQYISKNCLVSWFFFKSPNFPILSIKIFRFQISFLLFFLCQQESKEKLVECIRCDRRVTDLKRIGFYLCITEFAHEVNFNVIRQSGRNDSEERICAKVIEMECHPSEPFLFFSLFLSYTPCFEFGLSDHWMSILREKRVFNFIQRFYEYF